MEVSLSVCLFVWNVGSLVPSLPCMGMRLECCLSYEYHYHSQVAAGRNCSLEVHGLQPNEEYVFAVAAYTNTGELVGGAIGQTGRPLVATYHLPLLIAWGHLCQVCMYNQS